MLRFARWAAVSTAFRTCRLKAHRPNCLGRGWIEHRVRYQQLYMIKHEWTFICKEFTVTETGVFSIIEVSRGFLFEGFPGKIEPFTIVSSFLGEPGETFEYSIRFTDPLNANRQITT